jgi:tetratricopeptide (TPR) repeat protein
LDEALACANKALAVKPDSAPGHSLKGFVSQQRGDSADALRHFWAAHQVDPNNPEALCLSGWWRAAGGVDLEKARWLLERVSRTDPLTPMNKGAPGFLYWLNGDFHGAVQAFSDWQRGCEGVKSPYRIFLAYLHAGSGNVDEAVRLLDQVMADSPQHILTALATLLRHAWLGEKELALNAVPARNQQAIRWDDIWSLLMAVGYAQVGESESAIHWLDRTIDNGIHNVEFLQHHEPYLQRLRTDERFHSLMEKAGGLSRLLLDSLPTEEEV